MIDGPLYDEMLQVCMWGEYFPEDEPRVQAPLSAKELRGLMKRGWKRRFSDFRHGVWLAFTGLHPSENKKMTAFVAGFVAVLFSLLMVVNAAVDFMLRIGGAR